LGGWEDRWVRPRFSLGWLIVAGEWLAVANGGMGSVVYSCILFEIDSFWPWLSACLLFLVVFMAFAPDGRVCRTVRAGQAGSVRPQQRSSWTVTRSSASDRREH